MFQSRYKESHKTGLNSREGFGAVCTSHSDHHFKFLMLHSVSGRVKRV